MTKPLNTKALLHISTTYGVIPNHNKYPTQNYYYLPQTVINRIDKLNLRESERARILQFFVAIFTYVNAEESHGYYNISSKRLRHLLGRNYKFLLNLLISGKLLKANNKYSSGRFTKSYKLIIPKLEDATLALTSYKRRFPSPFSTMKTTKKIIKSLEIEINKAIQWIESYCDNIESEIEIDPAIPQVIRVFSEKSRTPVYRNGKVAHDMKRQGTPIYKHGDRYIFGDIKRYIKYKKKYLMTKHLNTLLGIVNKDHKLIYAHRNDTNQRLDTNITTIKSELLGFMSLDGQVLYNIDLCNSQFTIFASLLRALNDTSGKLYDFLTTMGYEIPALSFSLDMEAFITECRECNLYEFVGEKLSLSRREAKSACFEIFFSDPKYVNASKLMVSSLFPETVKWIDDFKLLNGYKAFPVMLQRIESHIFIDNILKELLYRGLPVLTKHDSVLCKQCDINKVRRIVSEHLDIWLGQGCYEIKVEAT